MVDSTRKRRKWDDDGGNTSLPTVTTIESSAQTNHDLESRRVAPQQQTDIDSLLNAHRQGLPIQENPQVDYFSNRKPAPTSAPTHAPARTSTSQAATKPVVLPVQPVAKIQSLSSSPSQKMVSVPSASTMPISQLSVPVRSTKDPLFDDRDFLQIFEETGARVETKGKYYPSKAYAALEKDPPLYLHVSGSSSERVIKALENIRGLIEEAAVVESLRPQMSTSGAFEAVVPIAMEPERGFNVRTKVVGISGANVKHINGQTRARIQIKGRGSGYLEPETNQEASLPLYLHITGPSPDSVESAKKLCEDLVDSVRAEYDAFRRATGREVDVGPPPTPLDYYNAYYQYYSSVVASTSPEPLTPEVQHQYAAYYAAAAAAAASGTALSPTDPYGFLLQSQPEQPKSESEDPFLLESASSKDYKNAPPPPNLYK